MTAPLFTASAFTAASVTLAVPPGAAAGDQAFLFTYDGWHNNGAPTGITGWTTMATDPNGGSWGDITLLKKILTAGDITTGSVTQGFNGSYFGYGALVVVPPNNVRLLGNSSFSGSGSTSTQDVVTAFEHDGATVLLFAVSRNDGVTPSPSFGGSGLTVLHSGAVLNGAGAIAYVERSTGVVEQFSWNFPAGQTHGLMVAENATSTTNTPYAGSVFDEEPALADTTGTTAAWVYKGRSNATADAGSVG